MLVIAPGEKSSNKVWKKKETWNSKEYNLNAIQINMVIAVYLFKPCVCFFVCIFGWEKSQEWKVR